MKKTYCFFPYAITATLLLGLSTSCDRNGGHGHKGGDGHAGHDHGGHDHDHEGMIPLAEIPGTSTQVVGGPSALSIWVPAEVMADEAARFVLSSAVGGIVGTLHVPPGRQVAAGTPLAEVRSLELARMYADWLSARARLATARASKEREERLFAKMATSQRDLDEAAGAAALAGAEEESARLALEACGITPEEGKGRAVWVLRAPRAGAVVEYTAISGQGVGAGQELGAFIAGGRDGAQAIVRFDLANPPLEDWEPGRGFAVRHSDGRQWQAKLEGRAPALSPVTLRRGYRLRLAGQALPLPGTPVEVEIPLPPTLTLPQEALQQVEGQWGVFIAHHGYAEFRPVRRGQDVGGEVVILGGIMSGDAVVVEGAYLLKAYRNKLANPEEEGHVH